ncbi:hypothetical protein GCM10010116_24170 [Microbispora rosea subsp. aerata]|nr:hypothetical protein [Microbispora rosea]GGO12036.1 hypothetical protein GCM10010116_24170 [Microbispora rosea subsp. aerata]GIH55654.1 hypothetical protein Mro02_25680 [Microbispora rosea subsp. aerata]
MPAQRKYPQELRDRAVKMVFELRRETGEKWASKGPAGSEPPDPAG